jgi:hypothetical protein
MRESTSWNQANGSTPHRLQEAMKLRNTAAVLPPPSLPKNVQLPRLWNQIHSRGYVQQRIMYSRLQRESAGGHFSLRRRRRPTIAAGGLRTAGAHNHSVWRKWRTLSVG